MKYRICQRCGAHLDYGERCDCEGQEEQRESGEKSPFPRPPVRVVHFTDWTEKSRKTA